MKPDNLKELSKDTWIQTYTGRKFNFVTPSPKQVSIHDIAIGLGRTVRFSGQGSRYYSVAEHSVWASHLGYTRHGLDVALYCLLHDAHEAYTGDLVWPLKILWPEIEGIEENIQRVIHEKFLLSDPDEDQGRAVRDIDRGLLLVERDSLFRDKMWDRPWDKAEIDIGDAEILPNQAASMFIKRFSDLQSVRLADIGQMLEQMDMTSGSERRNTNLVRAGGYQSTWRNSS